MRILLCGVRGSTPAPGAAFLRYGGHTSCVAIARDDEDPHLVLDAGTGLRSVSSTLDGRPFTGTILLGHLHWDHTHGLPFFAAGDRDDARVRLLMPEQGDAASRVMARVMSPPHFPIRVEELRGEWSIDSLEAGAHRIEGFEVTALDIPHSNTRTFGFRVSDGTSTIAYLSDHSPSDLGPGPHGHGEYHDAALKLATGADLLIHDAQYTMDDMATKAHFGHCTIDYAVGLAETAKAGALVLFHHDPDRSDEQIDDLVSKYQSSFLTVRAAVQGDEIVLR